MTAKQDQQRPAAPRSSTPRERARAATVSEAKTIALRQLAGGGVEAISLKAIALELGLTGPAIYRYFASRNELLTELIIDAYGDLATALEAATEAAATQAGPTQLHALADAYRAWALRQPHRYRLLFSAPVPGYDANAPRLVDAADRSMAIFLDAYASTAATAATEKPLTRPLTKQLRDWARRHARDSAAPTTLYRGIITWTRLHGFVSLEIEGAFASIGIDADTVFRREMEELTAS